MLSFMGNSGVIASSGGLYAANAVDFDGTNDYLTHTNFTGVVDGAVLAVSMYIYPVNVSNNPYIIGCNAGGGTPDHRVPQVRSDRTLRVRMENAALSAVVDFTTGTALTASSWNHVIFSFDLANSSNRAVYINDSLDSTTWTTYNTSGTIDLTPGNWFVGTSASSGDKLNGYLADVWARFGGSYLDITDTATRRKFIDADGKPVDLGADGSKPTGSAPQLFLRGESASWHTNKGTGGGLTEVGALTDAPSSPSD